MTPFIGTIKTFEQMYMWPPAYRISIDAILNVDFVTFEMFLNGSLTCANSLSRTLKLIALKKNTHNT